jgi:hypothetical protein
MDSEVSDFGVRGSWRDAMLTEAFGLKLSFGRASRVEMGLDWVLISSSLRSTSAGLGK